MFLIFLMFDGILAKTIDSHLMEFDKDHLRDSLYNHRPGHGGDHYINLPNNYLIRTENNDQY